MRILYGVLNSRLVIINQSKKLWNHGNIIWFYQSILLTYIPEIIDKLFFLKDHNNIVKKWEKQLSARVFMHLSRDKYCACVSLIYILLHILYHRCKAIDSVYIGGVRFARLYHVIKYVVCLIHEIQFHNSIIDG